ncbi:unnamed protein product, partial [Brassica napus]
CDFSLVIYRNTLNINKIDKFSHLFSALSSLFVFNQCSQWSSMLEIRDTSNTEVLIKGSLAMLRIVNCALAAVSISGCISLFVVFNSQGFVSLFSSMVVEFRGLLYVIGCLSVVFAPIFICCICFLVIVVSLAMMAMLSCSVNILSIL